jgi:hypothetical protein
MARFTNGENNRFEAWKNSGRGRIGVVRFDPAGHEVRESVTGGKILNITPEERRYNQDMAASVEQDFFSNGMLTPVRLIENDEDFDAIKGNKNLMTEDDMVASLKSKRGFKASLADISNVATLKRMIAIAKTDEVDASQSQIKALDERIAELSVGSIQAVEVEQSVTPIGPQR